jgi:hypothetical protein
MKHPLQSEPLTSITVDGKSIPVIGLPDHIQNEIATLNLYSQEYINALINLEKTEILLNVKKAQIEKLIKEALKPSSPQSTEPEVD